MTETIKIFVEDVLTGEYACRGEIETALRDIVDEAHSAGFRAGYKQAADDLAQLAADKTAE